MIKPFLTLAGAADYLRNNSLTGWTIQVHPGIYSETVTVQFDQTCDKTTVHLLGGVSIQGDSSMSTKALIQISGRTDITFVGDVPDIEFDNSINGPLGGASIVTNSSGQELFELINTNSADQRLQVDNISLIQNYNGSAINADIFSYNDNNSELHYLKVTNCYLRTLNTQLLIRGKGTDVPAETNIIWRNNYSKTAATSGALAMNFNLWSGSSINHYMLLRDNIFYNTGTGSLSSSAGHIRSRATQNSNWYHVWAGNHFYTDLSSNGTTQAYMWWDDGSSTNAMRINTINPCIHNRATVNTNIAVGGTIINLSAGSVELYGNLKLIAPSKFNRS